MSHAKVKFLPAGSAASSLDPSAAPDAPKALPEKFRKTFPEKNRKHISRTYPHPFYRIHSQGLIDLRLPPSRQGQKKKKKKARTVMDQLWQDQLTPFNILSPSLEMTGMLLLIRSRSGQGLLTLGMTSNPGVSQTCLATY